MFRRSYFACAGVLLNGVANLFITALFHWPIADVTPIANVRVWIQDVPKENWGIAGVSAKDLGR